MNNLLAPQRQHFLPKRGYLKKFAKDLTGFFHELRAADQRLTLRKVHIDQVCWVENFYDVVEREELLRLGLLNSRYLESSFGYEGSMGQILEALRNHACYLSRKDKELIVTAYVSMKHRVPKFRKEIQRSLAQGDLIDEVVGALKNEIRPTIEQYNFDFDGFTDEWKRRHQHDERFTRYVHLSGLVDSTRTMNQAVADAISKILSMNMRVLEVRGDQEFVFTSDNPGFSIDGNRVFNTNFGRFDEILWPINSKQVIQFYGFDARNLIYPLIRVSYSSISSAVLDQVNDMTFRVADERIFCENRAFLERFKARCKSVEAQQESLLQELQKRPQKD